MCKHVTAHTCRTAYCNAASCKMTTDQRIDAVQDAMEVMILSYLGPSVSSSSSRQRRGIFPVIHTKPMHTFTSRPVSAAIMLCVGNAELHQHCTMPLFCIGCYALIGGYSHPSMLTLGCILSTSPSFQVTPRSFPGSNTLRLLSDPCFMSVSPRPSVSGS